MFIIFGPRNDRYLRCLGIVLCVPPTPLHRARPCPTAVHRRVLRQEKGFGGKYGLDWRRPCCRHIRCRVARTKVPALSKQCEHARPHTLGGWGQTCSGAGRYVSTSRRSSPAQPLRFTSTWTPRSLMASAARQAACLRRWRKPPAHEAWTCSCHAAGERASPCSWVSMHTAAVRAD